MAKPLLTPEEAVEYLDQRLGPHRTARDFHNWCCPFCGDTKYRFGVNFGTGRCYCFKCETKGSVEQVLGIRLKGRRSLVPRNRLRGDPLHRLAPSSIPEGGLPWKALPGPGEKSSALADEALRYLDGRGIDSVTAWALDLGYGTRDKWLHHVIHPFYHDNGRMAGWQGRNVREGVEPKVWTSTQDDLPGALGASTGAVYLLEAVHHGEAVLVGEGPYDALSGGAVMPSVALLGSVLHPAQIRRIAKRRPSKVIIGFDPDKRVAALKACATVHRYTTLPVEILTWDPSLGDEVDLGELDADGVREVLATMVEPWHLGMVR